MPKPSHSRSSSNEPALGKELFLQVWPILSRWIAQNREASIRLRRSQQDSMSLWNEGFEEAALWEEMVLSLELDDFYDSLIQEDRNGSHDVEDGKIPAIGGPEPADGGSTGPAIGGPAPAISGSTGPAIGFPCRWRLHGLCLGCGTWGCQGCIRG